MSSLSVMQQVLDLARWAPSGDNTQPWRFEILSPNEVVIHGFDTRDHCMYDLDGRPSQLSIGALLETLQIAATAHGMVTEVSRRLSSAPTHPTFDVKLVAMTGLATSPLIKAIPARSVQRRVMQSRPVNDSLIQQLTEAVGPDHQLLWFGGLANRLRFASMLWANAGLRLRLPEAFEVHRSIIQWNARFSPDRIPDQALGADAPTLRLMRWAMTDWARVDFLNRYLGGTIVPRIQMDWLPAIACAAHVAIIAREVPDTIDAQVAGGRAVQRFWLTATRLGLQHQPAMTPLIFSRYVRLRQHFTADKGLEQQARQLASSLDGLLDGQASHAVWLGRIGHGQPARARSERPPLSDLTIQGKQDA
jgi:nitroreductase